MSSLIDSFNQLANAVAYNNAVNTQTNLSVDFINKFGSYSNNFSELTQIGAEKHMWHYIITGIFIFLSIVFYFAKQDEDKEDENKEKQEDITKKPLTILFYISIFIMIIFIFYSIYRYFFIYQPQYNQWLSSLPNDARNLLASINTITQAVNMLNNSYDNSSYRSNIRRSSRY